MTTTDQTDLLTKEQSNVSDRWIRIPAKGYCPYCGLSRSHLFDLIQKGQVRSVSLRKPGNIRGPRLILLSTVFAYIEREGKP